MTNLSADELRALFDYDPETGRLIRKTKRRKFLPGSIAGTVGTHGYCQISISGRLYLAHRIAWAIVHGDWPPPSMTVDHINGDRFDNRMENLRLATNKQNCANRRLSRNSSTGLKGVTKAKKKWWAQISRQDGSGQPRRIGLFSSPEEAHAAYVAEAEKIFGDFARDK